MSKRAAKPAKKQTLGFKIGVWVGALLSLGVLLLSGSAVKSDLASIRPCSVNSNGLTITNCGKEALNPGDFVLVALFILSACLVVSLFTVALRLVRRPKT